MDLVCDLSPNGIQPDVHEAPNFLPFGLVFTPAAAAFRRPRTVVTTIA